VVEPESHPPRERAGLRRQLADLRLRLADANPAVLAAHTGAVYVGDRELQLSLFGEPFVLTLPDLAVLDGRTRLEEPSLDTQTMLLLHLVTSNGAPLAGRWISFRELPDGGFYHQAYQGYTGHEITKCFGDDLGALESAALSLGGQPQGMGDAAYSFVALPCVPLLVAYWLGDEDFPSSARILFDASAGNHLPTDACALLGSTLTGRLIAHGRG
jgi:hypothetical protein